VSKKRDKIQAELDKIRKDHGGFLNPHHVVAYAKNDKTALHRLFKWDDGAAARAYRLCQARQIIRVYVTVIPNDNASKMTRVVISVPSHRRKKLGYVSLDMAMADKDMRAELLNEARGDMIRFRTKYNRLHELSKVFEAMDQVIQNEDVASAAAP
jgi:hypothetical protein